MARLRFDIIEIDEQFIRDGRQAGQEGLQAFEQGVPKDQCPYPPGSYCALQWGRSWARAFYWAGQGGRSDA